MLFVRYFNIIMALYEYLCHILCRFEKYISGKYLGEIVRVIAVKLVEDCVLFEGTASDALLTSGAFTTSFVSLIEQ
jgi:hexokinase